MRKKVLAISSVLLLLLGAIVYLFGFFELNRTSEAVERLFVKNDKFTHNQFDYSLFQSTLETRFKEGSNYKDLVRYTESLGGQCKLSADGESICRFYASERFCYVIWISIKTKIENDKIRSISSEKVEDGC